MKSSEQYENYFFFWLFPKPASDENTANPLVLYMNGGPGSSSMNALFMATGPLRVAQPGGKDDNSNFEVTYQPEDSW